MPPRYAHFCYQCLLEDGDEPRLEQLKSLAQFRRALWIAYEQNSINTQMEFQTRSGKFIICHAFLVKQGERLTRYYLEGFDSQTAASLVQRMEHEGFLKTRTQNATLQLKEGPSQKHAREQIYCNPLSYIGFLVGDESRR